GRTINGRHFEVRRIQDVKGIDGCQLVFVGSLDAKTLSGVLNAAREKHILTVGESSAKFAGAGGMIAFFTEDERVRFEINLTQVERAGLKISSKLLSLARLVR